MLSSPTAARQQRYCTGKPVAPSGGARGRSAGRAPDKETAPPSRVTSAERTDFLPFVDDRRATDFTSFYK